MLPFQMGRIWVSSPSFTQQQGCVNLPGVLPGLVKRPRTKLPCNFLKPPDVREQHMSLLASFMNLAGPDLIVTLLIILVLFGAKKLPELARGMRQAVKEFQKAKD